MLILNTDSLRGYGLNRIFELAKQAGYEAIDLAVKFTHFDTCNAQYLKKLIKEHDIPVHSISAPNPTGIKEVKELITLAKKIEAKVLILQPPKLFDFKMAGWLKKEIPKIRAKESISIALENAPSGTFLGFLPEHSLSKTSELKSFKHIALDTARIGEVKKDLMRAYGAFKQYLVHVHLSNLKHGKKYALPQEGIMPLESFLTKLRQDKYPGAISIKVLPKHLHAGDDEQVIDELQKVKKYYDRYYTNVDIGVEEEETPEED